MTNSRQNIIIAQAYERLYAPVLGYVIKKIGAEKRQDAEDIVQGSFCKLLQYEAFICEDSIAGLIYMIARNQVVDYMRHNARSVAVHEYLSRHSDTVSESTEEMVAASEIRHLEAECVSLMSPKKARAYRLYMHSSMGIKDISSLMGISTKTVENHIFRARADFRKMLKKVL